MVPAEHPWGSLLLTMAVHLINTEWDTSACHLTLVKAIVVCATSTGEGRNRVCEFLIDGVAFIRILNASRDRAMGTSSGRLETTVLPVSVSVDGLAHAQIWLTKQVIDPKYKPRFCKLYIPCSYEHSFCWIVCIALLAKKCLPKTIYVEHGFPDAIKSKYDLQAILHAIIDDKLCVVPPCNCQQPPTNTIKIIVKR